MYISITILCCIIWHTYVQDIHYQDIIQNVGRLPNIGHDHQVYQDLLLNHTKESGSLQILYDLQAFIH